MNNTNTFKEDTPGLNGAIVRFSIDKDFVKGLRFTYTEKRDQRDGEAKDIDDIFFHIPQAYKSKILALRGESDPDEREKKKEALPFWYPGGIYLGSHTTKDRVCFNPLICIDIDGKDNPRYNVDQLKRMAINWPYAMFAATSCGGRGVYWLVPLPDDAIDEARFKGYFNAIRRHLLQVAGIVIDKTCSNSNRGRYLSYDDEAVVNHRALVWRDCQPDAPEDRAEDIASLSLSRSSDLRQLWRIDAIVRQCEERGEYLAESSGEWFGIAAALANGLGECGRDYFLRMSAIWEYQTGRPQRINPNATFTRALKRGRAPLNYFFSLAKQCGIFASKGRQRRTRRYF